MIRIVTTKRLKELERFQALHQQAVIECSSGFGRWCSHNQIASAIAERMLRVLKGEGVVNIDVFRRSLGLDPARPQL